MRDILKLDIVLDNKGLLLLKPLPINGIQAEIRLSSTPEQLQTLKLLVPEIHSILFKFDELYRGFLSGKVTTYNMVQDILERFDTPQDLHNGMVTEDFLLDLTKELHERIGRIEALINTNVELSYDELYENEVTEERKAKFQKELAEFNDIPSKIHYAQIEKAKYLRDITGSVLQASGKIIGSGEPRSLLMDRYIDFQIEILNLELKGPENSIAQFQSIFNPDNNAYQVCIDLLEDLEVTVNGTCRLTIGKAVPLVGAIAAMKETPHFFKQDFNDKELLSYFNGHLNTEYKTFARRGKSFESDYDDAKTFIRNNFRK